MTNNELNQFILHYLVEDKTHSAIMLTGAWGTGKSYYIQNELVPFLKEEHEKECVTVSLYGIKSTAEISRSIYIELRAKTLSAKGEAAVAGKLIAKTIVRGVVSRFGIDFSKENDTMQELYESINLSNIGRSGVQEGTVLYAMHEKTRAWRRFSHCTSMHIFNVYPGQNALLFIKRQISAVPNRVV